MEQHKDNLNVEENNETLIERSEQHEELISEEELQQIINKIKNTYKEVVNDIFEDGDPFKQKIVDYFINRNDVNNEYTHILSNLPNAEKRQYADNLRDSLKDSGAFVSKMERYFATQDIYKSQKELKVNPRMATPEEYEMGVYSDFLEPQVKEAVFTLNKKGYKTFQSGYSEKDPRDQFIDVYNLDVEIPEDLNEVLFSYGVEARVENLDDRTTVTLHPIDAKKVIRQEEWKKIWDNFSKGLPEANSQLVENLKEPSLHHDFRRVQDLMRKIRES